MKKFVQRIFNFKRKIVVTVLIRTSNRPNYFKTCIESVFQQSYKSINIIVSYDDDKTYEYLKFHKGLKTIRVYPKKDNYPEKEIDRGKNLKKFPANLYFNDLMKEVKRGFIIYLDDDNCFTNTNSIQTIVDNISGSDDLIFWRVQFPHDKLIPEDEYFGSPPVFWHIDSCGFSFHSKYNTNAQWDGWKGGDFVVASKLYETVPNKIYINKILTSLQRTKGWGGFGDKTDKKANDCQ